ncbi:MAG TPA: hypothetical protein VGI39_28920 [Polyangiaceae bacterium]|jgi:hypothetical protein
MHPLSSRLTPWSSRPSVGGAGGSFLSSTAKAARAATLLVVAGVAAAPACKNTPTDAFQLEVPADVVSKVAWYEVGIFPGTVCGTLGSQLAGGVPPDGFVQRLAFEASNGTHPGIPNIARGRYGIAVAARAADCSVLATGCSDVDLSTVSSVNVALSDVSGAPLGACTNGATCAQARCAPNTADPTAGGGCSLQLVGAGPFADPLALISTLVSAPAIAVTPSGFVLAYREFDPAGGEARVTALPIDSNGGAGMPQQTSQTACAGNPVSDATGLFFAGNGGAIALARGACGLTAGIDVFPIDQSGQFGTSGFSDLGPTAVTLFNAHAMAPSAAGTFVAYAQGGIASIAALGGTSLGTPTPFGLSEVSGAWISASDQMIALLSAGLSSGSLPVTNDGGTGDDGGTPAETGADVGSVLGLSLAALGGAGSGVPPIGAPIVFPGTWGAVSAQAGRAYVVSDGSGMGQPVAYRAFDVGGTAAAVTDGFAVSGLSSVTAADVAFHQDHVFFAVEAPGAIALVAYDHATTTPTPLHQVLLGSDPRVPSLSAVRDGRLAVLASDTRVVVAWVTAQRLNGEDPVGGYAVFACASP